MLTRSLVSSNTFSLTRIGVNSSGGVVAEDLYVNSRAELEALLLANGVAAGDIESTIDAIWPVMIDPDTSLAYANYAAFDNQIYNQGGILKTDIVAAIPSGVVSTLTHYWDLDDDGSWVDDVAGGAWNLTEDGTVTTTTSGTPDGGGVALFNGTGDRLSRTGIAWDGAESKLSIVAWIKPSAIPSTGGWVLSWRDASSNNIAQIYVANSDSTIRGTVWDSSNVSSNCISTTAVSLDTWYFVALTDDGTTRKLYVNAVEEDTDTTSIGSYSSGSAPFGIGAISWAAPSGPTQFLGQIGMVGIFDGAISASQITGLYNSGAGKRFADL